MTATLTRGRTITVDDPADGTRVAEVPVATGAPHVVPSAPAENDFARPSGARPRWRLKSTYMLGVACTITPPATASEHSPCRSDWEARWSATSDEEHAVSTDTAGPSRPNT